MTMQSGGLQVFGPMAINYIDRGKNSSYIERKWLFVLTVWSEIMTTLQHAETKCEPILRHVLSTR